MSVTTDLRGPQADRIRQLGTFLSFILAITVVLVLQLSGGSELKGISCPVSSDDTCSEPPSFYPTHQLVGLFGVIENDRLFRYARKPAIDPEQFTTYRITHYGSPDFPPGNYVARWPETLDSMSAWADELKVDGICAVWHTTPWYNRIRDEHPPILMIKGHGIFLAVDRVGHGTDIDIYVEDSSVPLFAHDCEVIEIPWPDEETSDD